MHDILKDKQKHSPIQDIFGGSFQSQVVCLHCNFKSDTLDPIMDISLDIKNCESIEQAFYRYTTTEDLVRENQYKCEKCNRLRDAQKKVTIKKTPQVLTIQLKRFGFFSYSGSKVTRHIRYPEVLKLRPFSSDQQDATYNLYGVLVHAGHTCNSGHYYAFVKNGHSWFRMDDELTQPVTTQSVLSQSAYLLFYQKTNIQNLKSSAAETHGAKKPVKTIVERPVPRVYEEISSKVDAINVKVPESSNRKELHLNGVYHGQVSQKRDGNVNHPSIVKIKIEKKNEPVANGIHESSGAIPTSSLISRLPFSKEKSIEFIPSTPLQKGFVDGGPLPVNATTKWKSKPIATKELPKPIKVNSTISFTARPIVKKLSDLVSSLTDSVGATLNGSHEQKSTVKVRQTALDVNKSHVVVGGNGLDGDGNAFRMALQQQASKTQIRPWNHLATTETVFKRNQLVDILTKEQKRKRPSRDDMEYDAPLLKGLKKKHKKFENRIRAQ
jgi:hypothetical protein